MKKFIAIIIGLFLVLGFAGCNSDGSDINIDMDEFMTAPIGLSITGETLSWDAVENAKGYVVYADGEEVDKVTETSFDFSDLDGDKIIFQVQTRAPRGYQDSALSATIAYVANREAEVTAVSQEVAVMLPGLDGDVVEGLSEELVSKGVIGDDAEDMITSYGEFMSLMSVVDDFESFIYALDYLIENEGDNIEALVSALVKEVLPLYIEEEIEYFEMEIEWAYSDEIEAVYQQQVDMLEDLLDEIESNPEALVLAITTTIDYFVSVEEMINDNLITLIDGLAETEEPDDLNASELNEIKEEIVSVLRETMPTEEDMVLVMDVFDLLASATGTTMNYSNEVENFTGKLAAQTLYTLEALINFLDTFDEDYFEFVVEQLTSDSYYEVVQMEILIETIVYFDTFKDDNDALLDTISETFTEEEQEALFDDYLDAMEEIDIEGYNSVAASFSALNFQQLLNLQIIFEDSFDAVLDEFVETDGQILRVIAIYNSFTSYPDYMNQASGVEYDDWYEYYNARDLANIDVMIEAVNLMNAFFQSIDEDAMEEMTSFLTDSLFNLVYTSVEYSMGMYDELPFTESEIDDAREAIALGLDQANADILELVQNLFEYLVDEEVLAEYKIIMQAEQEDEDSEGYGTFIFLADHYSSFMNNSNSDLVDDILTVVFNTLKEDDLQALTDLTDSDVDEFDTMAQSLLTLLDEQFDAIKDMDGDNLSEADLAIIEAFMMSFQELLYSGYDY